MESEESSTPNFKLDDNFVSLEKDTEMKMLFDHRDMINIVQKLNVLQKRKLIRTDVKELCNKASNSLWAHRLFEQTLCWYHNKRKPRQLTTSFLMAHRELLSEMINSDWIQKRSSNATNKTKDLSLQGMFLIKVRKNTPCPLFQKLLKYV